MSLCRLKHVYFCLKTCSIKSACVPSNRVLHLQIIFDCYSRKRSLTTNMAEIVKIEDISCKTEANPSGGVNQLVRADEMEKENVPKLKELETVPPIKVEPCMTVGDEDQRNIEHVCDCDEGGTIKIEVCLDLSILFNLWYIFFTQSVNKC